MFATLLQCLSKVLFFRVFIGNVLKSRSLDTIVDQTMNGKGLLSNTTIYIVHTSIHKCHVYEHIPTDMANIIFVRIHFPEHGFIYFYTSYSRFYTPVCCCMQLNFLFGCIMLVVGCCPMFKATNKCNRKLHK